MGESEGESASIVAVESGKMMDICDDILEVLKYCKPLSE
jgi:hypothetical protein